MNCQLLSANLLTCLLLQLFGSSYQASQKQDPKEYDWPGRGYSRDLQQLARKKCFKVSILPTIEQHMVSELGEPLNYFDMEYKLRMDVSSIGKYGMFNPGAKEKFLSSLKEQHNTMTLNYYALYSDKIPLEIDGYGVEALNDIGRHTYEKNPRSFGRECGDEYIYSYSKGILLMMGLVLEFRNHEEKNIFESEGGSLFGNISEAVGKVRSLSTKHSIPGKMTVRAYQVGGEAQDLFEILTTNFLTCNFNVLEKCQVTVDYLSRYTLDFKKQFQNNSNNVPLFIIDYDPIDSIGLKAPPSCLTQDDAYTRGNFSVALERNQHYLKILKSFIEWYPIKFAYQKLCNALKKADDNVGMLSGPKGPAVCFNTPRKCKEVKNNIKLKPIQPHRLKLMKDMQYILPIEHGAFYPSGEYQGNWDFEPKAKYLVVEKKIDIEGKKCDFVLRLKDKNMEKSLDLIYEGYWDQEGKRCHGKLCKDLNKEKCSNATTIETRVSPFFFEGFDIKRDFN